MLVFIYLLFWLPLANNINREVPHHPQPKGTTHNDAALHYPAQPDPEDQNHPRLPQPHPQGRSISDNTYIFLITS
jgi:hypothetical protein